MILSDMIADARRHLDASDKFFSGDEVCDRLHASQQEILRSIAKEDATFFVKTHDLTLVSGTALYDLPLNARLGTRMIFAENNTNDFGLEVNPIDYRHYLSLEAPGLVNLSNSWNFMLEGSKVRVTPTPDTSSANAIKVWYTPTYGNMVQGRVDAATNNSANTTLILNSGSPDYVYEFGTIDRRDDYYNGMEVRIIDGTGEGQTRTITDYDGTTRTITVDSAWGSNPANSGGSRSSYCIMCPVPEDFHSVVTLRAAMLMSAKNRNRTEELTELYYGNPNRRGHYYELMAWIANRVFSRNEVVQPVDYGA